MTVSKDSAIFSQHGERHRLAAKRTKDCVAMPGVRNQVVCTPEPVCAGLLEFWPEGVAYDPCHGTGSILGAARATETRGLIDPWPHRTYCNPPYGDSLFDPVKEMEDYLIEQAFRDAVAGRNELAKKRAKHNGEPAPRKEMVKFPPGSGLPIRKAGLDNWLAMQLNASMGESIVLCPNRTNRKWLRKWRDRVTAKLELDPIAFIGSKDKAPFTLVLGFVGPESRIDDFHAAFGHLGDPA